MPSTKYVGFSYPTHFLKRSGSVIRKNFLNAELIKHHILRNEMICLHCWLYIKQKIGFFRAPVTIQFIVKV